jgi:BlaI family penicillinase repressor
VSEVRERLSARLAYTTVLTILQNLEAKEFVSHEEEGRAHRYFPRVARRAVRRSALSRLVDGFFQGSHEAMLAHLVEERALSSADLRHSARRLRERSKRKPVAR